MADGMFAYKGPKAYGLPLAERLEIVTRFWNDPVLALRELLPKWYFKKMPWVHRGLLALALERTDFLLNFGRETWPEEEAEWTIADLKKIEKNFVHKGQRLFKIEWDGGVPTHIEITVADKMATIMPRGFSKTTLFKGVLLLYVLYQIERVLLYISEAGPHACSQINDIRMELQFNERILELYGKLAPERQDPQKWTDEEFETLTGIHVIARGRGGQVRGLNRASTRPGVIFFDDLEDEESVSTEDQRSKVRKWGRGSMEQAGKRIGRTKIFGMGTILHFESFLVKLKDITEWMVVEFGALDCDNEPLWPEAMDMVALEAKKLSLAETNDLPVFYREFMSRMIPDEDKKFNLDQLVYRHMELEEFVARAIVIDPAISKKRGASLCALAVVGMTDKGRIHVLDVYAKAGMDPREQVDKYFELHLKHDCNRHGVEAIAYQQALVHLLQEEMFRKGKEPAYRGKSYFEVEPILHQTEEAKHKRIEGVLQPRYKSGYISHERVFPQLETALRDWPNCKMDVPDAVAMAITLLDPFAGLAAGDELHDDKDTPELEDAYEDFRSCP